MSRKEMITLALLTDAWERRLTRRQLAKELFISTNTVTAACLRHGVKLPKEGATKDGSKIYAIIADLLKQRDGGKPIVYQRVADEHGVSRSYISKIARGLEKEGVKF